MLTGGREGGKTSVLSKLQLQRSLEYDKANKQAIKPLPKKQQRGRGGGAEQANNNVAAVLQTIQHHLYLLYISMHIYTHTTLVRDCS